ncbi:MAG: J domain-containing protein [Planctomycetes bacterium]|nr:J domain-containing protein [Planctomycetota bacterium]MCH9726688.1 J domain-containing protein [Planctomycetota bacterium]MCH9779596.1 J domain-containing protein [Planctomycetota bacterium]MCH9791750.1 J domain-containing protein [Planctomycetota bacterium]MDF1742622.1 J domain-containing protein [Gimesia sp.]
MNKRDYYEILGISRSASADEIKKAYRTLSRKYHPDMAPDDKTADQKFKEVQEAYEVLRDETKRKQYDQFGHSFQQAGPGGGYYQSGGGGGQVDLDDLFGSGGVDLGDLFGGAFRGGKRAQPRPQKGDSSRLQIEIPFHLAAIGGDHEVSLQMGGKSERLTIKIPAGVDNGSVIRLSGQGSPGIHGGPAGDLLITIKVGKHPYFKRESSNLILEVPITLAEAALGAKVDVPTLSEGEVTVTIPPGTSSGAKLRLREKGIIDQKTRQPGDQICAIKIVAPKEISDEARTLYEQLKDMDPETPRSKVW